MRDPRRALVLFSGGQASTVGLAWAPAQSFGGDALTDQIVAHTHTCYLGGRGVRHAWGHGCGRCPAGRA